MDASVPSNLEVAGTVVVSTPHGLEALENLIHQITPVGFSVEFLFAVHMALEEALHNAARHGNRNDSTKRITLTWRADRSGIRVEVEDEGSGFDPESIPDPSTEDDRGATCGRGLLLMRSLMDEVQFNVSGNRVTMVKHNQPNHLQAAHRPVRCRPDRFKLRILTALS